MKKHSKNQKILFGVVLAFVFIASISFTYAYFSSGVTGNEEATQQLVTTGTLELLYTDGPEIEMNLIEPGSHISKKFSVENTGTYDVYYKIAWSGYVNSISNGELEVSYTCKNYSTYLGEDNASNVESGTCDSLNGKGLPITNEPESISDNIFIAPGDTQVYDLTVAFLETSSAQNYNQGKKFAGSINILESVEILTLQGVLLDEDENPISGATVEAHSKVVTSVTDENGIYSLRGIEVGTHTLNIYSEGNLIATDQIVLNTSTAANVESKRVAWNKGTNQNYLKIKVKDNQIDEYSMLSNVTVSLDPNGGDTIINNTKQVGFNSTYGSLIVPTREGYSFLGWFTEREGGTRVDNNFKYYGEDNHTLYAHWEQKTYTVSFYTNGGYCAVSEITVSVGGKYSNLPTPTKEGYVFLGWYTSLFDNPGTRINNTDTVNLTQNITLFARYEGAPVTVTLNPVGGSVSPTTVTVKNNEAYGTLPTPTKANYGFEGWYKDAECTNASKVLSTTSVTNSSAHTLYAKWVEPYIQFTNGVKPCMYCSVLTTLTGEAMVGSNTTVPITGGGYGTLQCSSSNTAKATCSISGANVLVRGVSTGTATITITATGASTTLTYNVTVLQTCSSGTYTVTLDATSGGKYSPITTGTTSSVSATCNNVLPTVTYSEYANYCYAADSCAGQTYNFRGYYTGKECNGTQIIDGLGTGITPWPYTATTLYACYQAGYGYILNY